MEPWYESTGPSEESVHNSMRNSHVYISLYKDLNYKEEDKFLCQIVSNALSKERERLNGPDKISQNECVVSHIKYKTIRCHPKWKELTQNILKEEVVSHKPYGSFRGFTTFVIGPLREKFIVRIIREIWAIYVLETKFIPAWLEHNYSPEGNGFSRTKNITVH